MAATLSRIVSTGGLVMAAAALTACATAPAGAGGAAGATAHTAAPLPGKPACFWLSNFDGSWTALNQSQLIVYAPLTSNPYLIQLFPPVFNLTFAQRLGFLDAERSGMICNNAQDELVLPGFQFQPHRITITAVRQLSKAQERQLLLQNGVRVPPAKHTGS